MRLAFRKVTKGWLGDFIGNAIAAHDPPKKYCHVELVISDLPNNLGEFECFSAHLQEGVRYAWLNLSPNEWDLIELPEFGQADRLKLIDWCDEHDGIKYDLTGALAFKLPWRRADDAKWFCSEIVLSALQQVGLLTFVDASITSPNLLYLLARASFGD